MTAHDASAKLLLGGLDGGNPLGFLAAVGTAVILQDMFPEVRLGWRQTPSGRRPLLHGCGNDQRELADKLAAALQGASSAALDIDNRMPFDAGEFSCELGDVQRRSSLADRRDADFLSGFGTELYPDKKTGQFQDSRFRMVRSGDSAGQGLPFYAKEIRKATAPAHIRRALFHAWDYRDEGYSLRWDPIEDRRYALRWGNPSKSKSGTMFAANALAVEALRCFPVFIPSGKQAQTTGFQRTEPREIAFVWPVWTPPVNMDTLRSLLALSDLGKEPLPRGDLAKIGIDEVYCSRRVAQNQYYSNFLPAQPL